MPAHRHHRRPRAAGRRPSPQPRTAGGIYEVGGPDVVTYAEMMAPLRRGRGTPPTPPHPGAGPYARALVALGWPRDAGTGPTGPRTRRVVWSTRWSSTAALGRIFSNTPRTPGGHRPEPRRDPGGRRPYLVRRRRLWPSFRPTVTDPTWSGGTVLTDIRRRGAQPNPLVFRSSSRSAETRAGIQAGWLWQHPRAPRPARRRPGPASGTPVGKLGIGDPVDFWRVEALFRASLRLRAEMRLPGKRG